MDLRWSLLWRRSRTDAPGSAFLFKKHILELSNRLSNSSLNLSCTLSFSCSFSVTSEESHITDNMGEYYEAFPCLSKLGFGLLSALVSEQKLPSSLQVNGVLDPSPVPLLGGACPYPPHLPCSWLWGLHCAVGSAHGSGTVTSFDAGVHVVWHCPCLGARCLNMVNPQTTDSQHTELGFINRLYIPLPTASQHRGGRRAQTCHTESQTNNGSARGTSSFLDIEWSYAN